MVRNLCIDLLCLFSLKETIEEILSLDDFKVPVGCNMEDLHFVISNLEVPTPHLTSNILQEVLMKIKKNNKAFSNNHYMELNNRILDILWTHLQSELKEFDDQLLCSTCFYAVLSVVEKQESYLHLILQNIDDELCKRKKLKGDKSTLRTVSIIYGIFQSSLLLQKSEQHCNILEDILKSVMDLLIDMAYEYSHYTFIVFKILASLKKVLDTNLQHTVFTKTNQLRLLNMVNHNWENPINGVRNFNKCILQTIMSIIDKDIYGEIVKEINTFYWNKAKYLFFIEILEHYNGNIGDILKKYNIVEGLMHSLHKPGLVSAGADLYFSVLKKIKSDDEWESIFLKEIRLILNSSSQKSIDNFNNYWCLTTFKKFPSLSTFILNALQSCEESEKNTLSMLCILRQSNKLNIIEKSGFPKATLDKFVMNGIEHASPFIRMAAFDVVCVSHSKSWPESIKYQLVLRYLSDNVNSDCTVLRLSMLNSLSSFLNHLQSIHLNSKGSSQNDLDNLIEFCVGLQMLIINSLKLNGNYQRKITTIKIAYIVCNSLNEVPRKKRKQMIQTNFTLMKFIMEKRQWILFSEKVIENLINVLSDPADDVRENVKELLIVHYGTMLMQPHTLNQIIDHAITKMNSKFFYDISCGKSMFELSIQVLIRNASCIEGVKFQNIEEIFNFAFNNLHTEYILKRDIVESIEKGKQLHSYMCVLCAVFEAILNVSYDLQISKDTVWTLLEILEDTSCQFIWEQGLASSSDFSKMSDMVQKIIENSGYGEYDDGDEAKITGLQQIVLNCLWLNVKESCNLASLLIRYYKHDMDIDTCRKSLNVIIKVLETSRHKGAIEAAGVSLGESIQTLTSLPECQLKELPLLLLEEKLKEFILDANNMASVTRRGAGLSIMVHRIVSNDMQKNKPLFHYFINTILNCCRILEDDQTLIAVSDLNSKKDLPKAIYIHFLTRIVTDSSLTTEVMYYSAQLVELAFDNLISPHWQIRNAALQLYGALVPKLMGQKKASGSEDEVTATVACDEFRTHFPQLWIFILNQLKQDDDKEKLQAHSNLLPILNILGNLAKRYNFSNDVKQVMDTENDFFKHLTPLLGSPILTVRRLTAKCIFNMYSFDNIFEFFLRVQKPSENFLHGCLLLLVNCNKYYKGLEYKAKFDMLKDKFVTVMRISHHSYLCLELIEDLYNDRLYEFSEIQLALKLTKTPVNGPGKFQWANRRIHKYLLKCPWSIIPQCLELILENCDSEKYCQIFYTRLSTEYNTDNKVLIQVTKILIASLRHKSSSIVWKILYKISLLIDYDQHFDSKIIIDHLKENVSYKMRFVIPLVARITRDADVLLTLSKQIHKLCNAEVADVDMRIIAATANNELGIKLWALSDEIKIISIINTVILLQDEDEEVRNLSVYFYKNAIKTETVLHSYVCLGSILDYKFLKSALCEVKSGVKSICDGLSNQVSLEVSNNSDGFNPFTNKSKNIYQEINIINQLISKLKAIDLT